MLVVVVLGDKLVRATELVKLLSVEKSVKGAIQLATALKLPSLAEKFNSILEVNYQCQTDNMFFTGANWILFPLWWFNHYVSTLKTGTIA